MSFVLDASVTLAWYFEDERTKATEALFDLVAETGAVVPALWRIEVANVFQSAVRHKRITPQARDGWLAQLATLPIAIDGDTDRYVWTTTVRLADRFSLTIYDATYLEVAQRSSLPLATLDKELRRAAQALDIALLGVE